MVRNDASFHAHSVNWTFDIRFFNGKPIITFNTTLVKGFSVAVAYLFNGFWRLRCRLVVSPQDGVLCFPLFKTHGKSEVYSSNTVLVIGIATDEMQATAKLRIYGNRTGSIDANRFNGYEGTIKIDKFLDNAVFSDTLQSNRYGNSIRFDRSLYQYTHRQRPANLLAQARIPEDSWCSNCSVLLSRYNTIQNYRTDVYAQMPMPIIKVFIKDPRDMIYVLNKTSGNFEVILLLLLLYSTFLDNLIE